MPLNSQQQTLLFYQLGADSADMLLILRNRKDQTSWEKPSSWNPLLLLCDTIGGPTLGKDSWEPDIWLCEPILLNLTLPNAAPTKLNRKGGGKRGNSSLQILHMGQLHKLTIFVMLWYRVSFLTGTPQFQYQKENRQAANHSTGFTGTAAVIGWLMHHQQRLLFEMFSQSVSFVQ